MTLNELVLQKLADWRLPRDSRQTLPIADEGTGWSVAVTADRHDDLGTALWELTLRHSTPRNRTAGDLKIWAENVCGRVTGLLEPLRVVEIDTRSDAALLRSQEPTKRGGELYYYEVLLQGAGQVTARRFHAHPNGGRREQVPFALTHEVLAKFITDLAAQ
jgi:hypothetical protein